jgi:flagellar hook-associated protein 1 FlgK
MSLLGVLNVGGSALAAQQAALQVTGNNLANAADPNYSREVANLSPNGDVQTAGGLLGSGVSVESVSRQVDLALQERIRSAYSDQYSSTTLQNWSGQVQSVFNALSGNGLSDQLNTFFNDWSTLANNPSDAGQRQVVIQDGQNVASTFNSLSGNLTSLSSSVQSSMSQQVQQVNQITGQIATLNQQIVSASAGGTQQPNSLLDQRDADLQQLSQLVNIQTTTQPVGSVNVYLGSETLVTGTTAQNLSASTVTNNGHLDTQVKFQDGSTANITGGSIGGLFQSQQLIDSTSDSLNSLASNLVNSLNQIHASGQGLEGFTSVTATNAVADPTQPLAGASSGLPSTPSSGSFVIHLTDTTTGLSTSSLVPVYGSVAASPTTLNSLAASLNGVSGVQATISNGKLQIASTDPNVQISFSQDTSGVLSSLGINTFFSGTNASNIAVNSQVASNPSLLAAAANGNPDDNTTALAIANLSNAAQSGLNGQTLSDAYGGLIQNVGSAASNATQDTTTNTTVQETLSAQEQNLSGVSTDEEALNMIMQQRSYEGAAELISVVNNMLQTLLAVA